MPLEGYLPALGALALGAASAPLLTNMFIPKHKTTFLYTKIPWSHIDQDNKTVHTLGRKPGSFRVIQLKGFDYSAASQEEIKSHYVSRLEFFKSIAENPATLRFVSVRRRLPIQPPLNQSGLGDIIDKLWFQRFTNAFTTDHYIIVYTDHKNKRRLGPIEEQILTQWVNYKPSILTLYGESPTDPSPLLTFLARIINPITPPVAPKKNHLSDYLANTSINTDAKGNIIYDIDGTNKYGAIYSVKNWPDDTIQDIVIDLMQIPAAIDLQLRVKPEPKTTADLTINNRRRAARLEFSSTVNNEWETIADKINSNKDAFCPTELTINIVADSQEELSEIAYEINTRLVQHTTRTVRETLLAERLWLSRLPGQEQFNRPYNLLATNVADLTPLGIEAHGRNESQWGPSPIRYFPTTANSPYGLVFHKSSHEDLAHGLVIGPPGTGKSVLAMFLIFGALGAYPDLRAFVFDSLQGVKTPFDCYGGDYLIPHDKNLPLNPFLLPDNDDNRKFLNYFMRILCEVKDDDPDTEKRDKALKEIESAIDIMYGRDPINRKLNHQPTQLFSAGPLRKSLEKWTTGNLANIFNGERNALNFEKSRLIGFDMTEMQRDPQLNAAMTYFIMHSMRATVLANPTPHIVFIDEAPYMLKDPVFTSYVEFLLRQHRKLQGSIILASQDPGAFVNSEIAEVILDNIAWVIFHKNPNARRKDYEAFHLTDDQWAFITGSGGPGSKLPRSALFWRHNESVILNTDLSALGPYLRAFSANVLNRVNLQHAKERYGTQWLNHFIND